MINMHTDLENRESKKFWYADFNELRAVEHTGYKCAEEGAWWFPELQWTLWEGKQIFSEQRDAELKILDTCYYHIPRYAEALKLYTEKK